LAQSSLPGGKFDLPSFSHMRQSVARWLGEQRDLLPPYKHYEGEVWGKHIRGGLYYLELDGDAVEVDKLAYSLLEVGEAVKVRYTRGLRAINIDRFAPNGAPGSPGSNGN
jgi:hypothetical protein